MCSNAISPPQPLAQPHRLVNQFFYSAFYTLKSCRLSGRSEAELIELFQSMDDLQIAKCGNEIQLALRIFMSSHTLPNGPFSIELTKDFEQLVKTVQSSGGRS